jgi:asparagine synthase (glutamine-hydrolysing)
LFRYIALIWNPKNPAASEIVCLLSRRISDVVSTLRESFRSDGLTVMCSDVEANSLKPYHLENVSGVVLGRLFRRNSDINDDRAAEECAFNSADSDRLIASKGRSLITDYWGEYVAFLIDKSDAVKRIIKDPTGSLPCFYCSWRNVDIAFSCLSDCIDLGLLPFTINWSYVASNVGSGGYDASLKSLNEVTEVHRGECLEITSEGRSAVKLYWNPTSFAEPGCAMESVSSAVQALRASVRSATRALAQSHEKILMRLSGGLDSSIISGCLRDIAPRPVVTSYTYFAPHGRSDERRWARLAADYAGSEHLELEMNPSNVRLDSLIGARPSVSPTSAFSQLKLGEMEREIAATHSYTAVFSGDGGDSVLGGVCIPSAVDDFIRLRGLSRGIFKLAAQVALRTNTLAWHVLCNAARRRMFGSDMRDYREKLLRGTALAADNTRGLRLNCDAFPHPWFEEHTEVPWHIINRLGNLIAPPDFYNPFVPPAAPSPFVASPLYSQPVVELSLRIPVFAHFFEGRERGLARTAFGHEVPAPILQRQWKDRAPGVFEELVFRNRKFLREMLLGGALCSHKLLDAGAIESVLSDDFNTKPFFVNELMKHLILEIWVRHFVASPIQKLAA